jgi:hypothetical protein
MYNLGYDVTILTHELVTYYNNMSPQINSP